MSADSWFRNARGEWYVVAQVALMLTVLGAPRLDPSSDAPSASWSGVRGAAGGFLCVVGLTFVVLGSIGLGRKNLSPFPKPIETSSLVENGIFSIVRHPIYSGFSLLAFGWSLGWASGAALIAALALLAFFDVKARREERWLEAKFPRYGVYRARVKKLIPFVY